MPAQSNSKPEGATEQPLWKPSPALLQTCQMADFMRAARQASGQALADYKALHQWSITDPAAFWQLLWDHCGVIGERGKLILAGDGSMRGGQWFPEAQLNFSENLLRPEADAQAQALVFWGEDKCKQSLTRQELRSAVARFAAALRAAGIVKGDRVAAFMPNMPATLIAMLATASLGAVFTSASPDFGVQGVLDRFGQTEPSLMLACDGYWYNGKAVDIRGKLRELMPQLGSVRRLVIVPYLATTSGQDYACTDIPRAVLYDDFIAAHDDDCELEFVRSDFNHPLYIMYSSGTTGVPKCIVHGAGGTLLQHLKEHRLHTDVRPGDRFFYFTTCGWMMWNWLVSGLASGATLMLYDGNPFLHDGKLLWDFAEQEAISHFGTSAKYIETLAKGSIRPRQSHDLAALRLITSTGSPLAPQSFDFVYAAIKPDVQLASISGGTDIISCFVLGNPLLPVWRGEIQCPGLGLAVEVWNEDGQPVVGEKGELVCRQSFPCMPTGFWQDTDGSKYTSAYFERFAGVWCHGDYCEQTPHGGLIIYGRSDATLNPGGVRIGTAEIYRQVERLPEVLESIVIGQDWPPEAPCDVRVILFVRLRVGLSLDTDLVKRIKQCIRDNASPRHVPAQILAVEDIPRTKSGKIVELAVRNIVHGHPVKNLEALANPEALQQFANRPELRS